jgi:hypothetical protein
MPANEIAVKLVLDDNLASQFAQASKGAKVEADKMGKSIADAGNAGMTEFNKHVSREIGHTIHGFESISVRAMAFGNDLASGNVMGAIQSFAGMSVTAFRAVGIEIALATGGISVIAGAIAVHVLRAKKDAEDLKKLQDDVKKDQAEIANIELELMRKGRDRDSEELERWYDKQLGIIADAGVRETELYKKEHVKTYADLFAHKADLLAINKKYGDMTNSLDEEYAQRKLDIEDKYYWEPYLAQLDSNQKEASADRKKWNDLIIAGQEKIAKMETDIKIETEKASIDATKAAADERRRIHEMELDDHVNEQIAAWQKEQQALDQQAQRYEQYAQSVGAAMTAGLGKGAEGLKESLKAILTVFLSAIEREVLLGFVGAGARALMGDFSGLFQMAGVTAAFEAAKVGVASFAVGGDFTTNGPRLIMVGDNPGGRERVSVTPMSSANVNGPQGGMNIHMGDVHVSGNADSTTVRAINDTRERQLKRLRRMLQDLGYARQMPSFA